MQNLALACYLLLHRIHVCIADVRKCEFASTVCFIFISRMYDEMQTFGCEKE